MVIEIKDYTKVLKGNTVLDNINYTFESGHVYGLVGKNGCGKTMMLRAISGLIQPTSGSVTIDGKVMGKDLEFPESIGIIIENMQMLGEYNAFDNLKILAKINKIATDDDIREAIRKVGLDPDDKKHVRKYSLGMKQKLNIAQAIMEKPKLLLLDEPTNALDEESVNKIRNIMVDLKAQDTLIIIASHNKEDIEIMCDSVLNISAGRIVQNENQEIKDN